MNTKSETKTLNFKHKNQTSTKFKVQIKLTTAQSTIKQNNHVQLAHSVQLQLTQRTQHHMYIYCSVLPSIFKVLKKIINNLSTKKYHVYE